MKRGVAALGGAGGGRPRHERRQDWPLGAPLVASMGSDTIELVELAALARLERSSMARLFRYSLLGGHSI